MSEPLGAMASTDAKPSARSLKRGDVLAASGVGGKGGASAADAFSAYGAAVAHDPLSEQAACGWASTAPAGDPVAAVARDLCDAARQRQAPPVGRD